MRGFSVVLLSVGLLTAWGRQPILQPSPVRPRGSGAGTQVGQPRPQKPKDLPKLLSLSGAGSFVSGPHTISRYNGSSVEFVSTRLTVDGNLGPSLALDLKGGTAELRSPSGFVHEPWRG